jgi:hypothetical protein
MPLEIRELVIRATIGDSETTASGGGGSSKDQAAIVATCVEQVLAILKEKTER